MKTLLRSFLLCLPLFLRGTTASLPAQQLWWKWQHPLPTGNDLKDVALLSPDSAFIVGYNGLIISTTDGGTAWRSHTSPSSNHLYTIAFNDSRHGFIGGINSTFMATTDGGETWTSRPLGKQAFVTKIRFASHDVGFIVGGSLTPSSMMLRTTSGGTVWEDLTVPTTQPINDIATIGTDQIWGVGGMGTIIHSSDGGEHWEVQRVDTTSLTHALTGVYFRDSLNGIAVGENNRIMSTTDGGDSWTTLREDFNSGRHLYGIAFSDSLTGFAVGPNSSYKTTDGGKTWQSYQFAAIITSIVFNKDRYGFAVGQIGEVRRTTDGGDSWTKLSSRVTTLDLTDVVFTDSARGLAVGNLGSVMRTTDGGESWTQILAPGSKDLSAISCSDPMNCCAAGKNGGFSYTTDGGLSWDAGSTGGASLLFDVSMPDSNHAWAVGGSGSIFRTVNGGASWAQQESGTTSLLFGVSFYDSTFGMAVGMNNTVLRTTDGSTWTPLSVGASGNFVCVTIVDRQTAFISAIGTLLRTTDGGETWTKLTIPSNATISSQAFISRTEGWIALDQGDVVHTTDAGEHWRHEPNGVSETNVAIRFSGMSFTDSRNGTIVGAGAIILRYIPDGSAVQTVIAPVLDPELCDQTEQPSTVTLEWNSVSNAVAYHVQVARNPAFDFTSQPPVLDAGGITDTFRLVTNLSPLTTYYWRVNASNGAISSPWSDVCSFTTSGTGTVLPTEPTTASILALDPPQPNPVAGTVTIRFRMARAAGVTVAVYDIAGHEVMTVGEQRFSAGEHSLELNMEDLPDGQYHIQLKGLQKTVTQTLLVRH